jgi:hypothetical protein
MRAGIDVWACCSSNEGAGHSLSASNPGQSAMLVYRDVQVHAPPHITSRISLLPLVMTESAASRASLRDCDHERSV